MQFIKKYLPDILIIGGVLSVLLQKLRTEVVPFGEPMLKFVKGQPVRIHPINYDYHLEIIIPLILILVGIDIVIRRLIAHNNQRFCYEDVDIDDLYDEAKKLALEEGKASVAFLQRKLKIGYSRSAQLLDMMEEEGLVGPANGSKPREILKK